MEQGHPTHAEPKTQVGGHGGRDATLSPDDRDPVCGMKVKPDTPHRHDHAGTTYRFCSAGCMRKFQADPGKYVGPAPPAPPAATSAGPLPTRAPEWTCPMHPEIVRDGPGSCPICGMALEPRTVSLGDEENPALVDMTRRFRLSVVLVLPLVLMAMGEWLPGVLFRNAEAFETLRKVDTLVVDKTGTLTEGKPALVTVEPVEGGDAARLLRVAASLERGSEHPLAATIVAGAEARALTLSKAEPGRGRDGDRDRRGDGERGVTLVKGDLRGIVRARRLSRATMANIRQNLFFAFVYNALGALPVLRTAAEPHDRGDGDGLQLGVGDRERPAAAGGDGVTFRVVRQVGRAG